MRLQSRQGQNIGSNPNDRKPPSPVRDEIWIRIIFKMPIHILSLTGLKGLVVSLVTDILSLTGGAILFCVESPVRDEI
jgi:hypothetical protein